VAENPCKNWLRVRLTDADREKLEYTAAALNMKLSTVIRQGLEIMYQKAKEKE
jgi:hypothetical protein